MKRRAKLVVAAASIIVVTVLLGLLVLPALFPPTSVSLPYKAGDVQSYASGSSSCVVFSLQRAAVLTGSFATNSSLTAAISQVSNPQENTVCQNVNGYYYTTGNVNHATLSVVLPAGTYLLVFMFTNDTTAQTSFNVTQSFVATYHK